jgi:hypothetical protein
MHAEKVPLCTVYRKEWTRSLFQIQDSWLLLDGQNRQLAEKVLMWQVAVSSGAVSCQGPCFGMKILYNYENGVRSDRFYAKTGAKGVRRC